MAGATVVLSGRAAREGQMARLLSSGMPPLVLPWWPDEIEYSGWAANWAETERPGRAPILSRSSDPLPSVRIAFTLNSGDVLESVGKQLAAIRALAAAKPVVQLMLGESDRGTWRVAEAGANETDWAPDGQACAVDVVISLRSASDASVAVGPVGKKPKR
jgi:hypothetical protein